MSIELQNQDEILKKIAELKKTYEFRHLFAGTVGLFKCDCCGKTTHSVENLYNKDPNKHNGIDICHSCSELWRNS